MSENEIAQQIIAAALHIHRTFGPGLSEHVYEKILVYELNKHGLEVKRQRAIPVFYDGIQMEKIGYRADLIVEEKVLVELKSVETLSPVHFKQVLTYIRLANIKLGLLINFNEEILLKGVKRIANKL